MLVKQYIHVRIACSNLSRENQDLKVALATRPTLPDPTIIYIEKIAERQNQVIGMQETLSTTVKEA